MFLFHVGNVHNYVLCTFFKSIISMTSFGYNEYMSSSSVEDIEQFSRVQIARMHIFVIFRDSTGKRACFYAMLVMYLVYVVFLNIS